jgi:DNA polymerase III subunit alpha
MEVSTPDGTAGDTGPFVVSMPEARCIPPVVERLKEALRTHPGPTEVHLRLLAGSRVKVLRLDNKLRVTPSPALLADLKQLLGPGCVGTLPAA